MRTITKLAAFVIVSVLGTLGLPACGALGHSTTFEKAERPRGDSRHFDPPEVLGNMDADLIPESSGLTASRCQDKVLWTHNDSGGGPYIYAVDLKGKTLGIWKVSGADDRDWEDIATAKDPDGICYLYIGDIGDNDEQHKSVTVYRVREPVVDDSRIPRKRKDAVATSKAETITIKYPDGSHNAETLLVHPQELDIWIVTKSQSRPAVVFKLGSDDWKAAISSGSAAISEKIAEFRVPSIAGGFLTGGEISPDGRRVAITDYLSAYEYSLPSSESDLRQAWEQKPVIIETGARKQGEAIAYSPDSDSLYLTSEKKPAPLIRIKRKKGE